MNKISRRNWFRISLSATGSILLTSNLKASALDNFFKEQPGSFSKSDFGNGFIWGTSSASYQVEGGKSDGKGEDIWDRFSHIPGKIKTGENGDTATDFYHLFKEDIKHIKEMNFTAFRFSLAWSRIFPKGTGDINPKGVEFYHQLIDACLENGITPG